MEKLLIKCLKNIEDIKGTYYPFATNYAAPANCSHIW